MQDTVDQAYGAVPRTLANIIEDARRAADEADARPAGVGTSGSQGSPGKDPGSIEKERRRGAEPLRRCRVPGRGLQEATVVGMPGVRPGQVSGYPGHPGEFGRPLLTLSDRLDQLVPAGDGEAAVAFRTAGQIWPARTGDAGDYFQVAGRRPRGRWACRAGLPSVRAVRPHHSTTVMRCHVRAGAARDGVPDRGQPRGVQADRRRLPR
jgi:hypothetical protein